MNPMASFLFDVSRNIFLWIFLAGMLGGYLMLRLANSNRDKAAFADFPDRPEKYMLRARAFYGLFVVCLLATIAGLAVVLFQVLQTLQPELLGLAPTATAEATTAPTETRLPATPTLRPATATPRPTSTPLPTAAPTISPGTPGVIGNSNFEGVNVRAAPSLGGDIVARLVNKTNVIVLDVPPVEADGYTWLQIRLEDGTEGWVAAQFVILPEPAQ